MQVPMLDGNPFQWLEINFEWMHHDTNLGYHSAMIRVELSLNQKYHR